MRDLKGDLVMVESMAQNWDTSTGASPRNEYEPKRIGSNFDAAAIDLRRDSERSILAACGIPISVVSGDDATAFREGYRQFLHQQIQPLGRIVERAIRTTFDVDFKLNFDDLFAADVQGSARAYASMVNADMPEDVAAKFAGLDVDRIVQIESQLDRSALEPYGSPLPAAKTIRKAWAMRHNIAIRLSVRWTLVYFNEDTSTFHKAWRRL